jgi:hypothetical protein
MTHLAFAAATDMPPTPGQGPSATPYRPGACNIGAAEIARRRRAGHVGALITVVVLALLVAVHAAPAARLLIAIPAAGAASGYLQAWLRFCAAFGSRGIFNFGQLGQTSSVADPGASGSGPGEGHPDRLRQPRDRRRRCCGDGAPLTGRILRVA